MLRIKSHKSKNVRNAVAGFLAVGLTSSGVSFGQPDQPEPGLAVVNTYGEAIANALQTNPTVVSAYYEFEAAREAQRAAEGRLYPTVDLDAEYGWEDRQTPVQDFGEYEKDSARFSITQLLFDGFKTRDEARALGYEKLAQYYITHEAANDVSLSATIAYLDTVLYQKLVGFAEENYVVHRQIFNKIAERVEAGRDERVNFEQATARMALAESNLLTEVTNLHDTRAEFQRVINALPADELPLPYLPQDTLPKLRDEALANAYQKSPELNRSIEALRSAREALNASRGPMYPRLDLRYRNQQESNINGFRGDYDLEAIELVLTYNLYRGGEDSARRREYSNRYYAALEAQKEACLAVRREVTIAFNDIRVLEQQVRYLSQQLDSQNKTRQAYNDQFDRNQRTLLDLLDSQNEYFDTQRALATAQTKLVVAQATVLGEMGILTDTLDAKGFNADKVEELDLDLSRDDDENIPLCGGAVVQAIDIDQQAIFERLNARAGD